jgi:hypothetical protein
MPDNSSNPWQDHYQETTPKTAGQFHGKTHHALPQTGWSIWYKKNGDENDHNQCTDYWGEMALQVTKSPTPVVLTGA